MSTTPINLSEYTPEQLAYDLRYQRFDGVCTWGLCSMNCGNYARDSRVCEACLMAEIERRKVK